MSRRVFLSDLHVSAGLSFQEGSAGHKYDWFTSGDSTRTVAFLRWVKEQADPASADPPVDEVILLGDVFDNWVFPHDSKPPTMAAIIRSNHASEVVAALKDLANDTGVYFVPGNHDQTLGAEALALISDKIVHAPPPFIVGRVRAEHGNLEALCCAPDPDRWQHIPLGYFISRLAATADRDFGSHFPTMTTIMRELIDVTKPERLGESILDAMCARLHLDDTSLIMMPNDIWDGEPVTIGALKLMYRDIFTKWVRRNGTMSALRSIPAEMGLLEPVASAHLQSDATTVIFGHTHDARAEGYINLRGRTVYANTGAWCGGKGSWVELERKSKVSISKAMKWTSNGPELIAGPYSAD